MTSAASLCEHEAQRASSQYRTFFAPVSSSLSKVNETFFSPYDWTFQMENLQQNYFTDKFNYNKAAVFYLLYVATALKGP